MASHLTITKVRFEVRAICFVNESYQTETPAIDFLYTHAKAGQYSSSAKGFKPLFERYATAGRSNLTTELFHEVDKNEKIWEFIKGDLRIFCFFDENHVVLTHGAIKKSQKVDKNDVVKAVSCKNAYFS